ncbi:MAG: hypothetical protein ACP5HT_06165 [Conexivisphaera sp.]
MLADIWSAIEWRTRPVKGKRQVRRIPYLRKDREFRRELRNKYLEGWEYSAHWVDSALKVAFSIMESWRKNYLKGRRKAICPQATRLFARVKKTLFKLENDELRISVRPNEFVYIDLSRRYFRLGAIGEPIITLGRIYLPMYVEDSVGDRPIARAIGWDFNMGSLDGFSPETGWIRIDTTALAKVHERMKGKRGRVQSKVKGERTKRRLLEKYRGRERNRARNHQIKIAKTIRELGEVNGFEGLDKRGMLTRSRPWNRRIADTDWRGIAARVSMGGGAVEVDPYLTSRTCSRCGWVNRDLRGSGLRVRGVRPEDRRAAERRREHIHEDGGRSPQRCMVGRDRPAGARGWVRPDGGGAEGPR